MSALVQPAEPCSARGPGPGPVLDRGYHRRLSVGVGVHVRPARAQQVPLGALVQLAVTRVAAEVVAQEQVVRRGGVADLQDVDVHIQLRGAHQPVRGLRIVDCYGGEVHLGGAFERLVVNDVDVTSYVAAELDRLHPVRVLARDALSPEDYHSAWAAVESQWEATLDRASRLPAAMLHEQVDGEWSLVQTQRHLLFASDAWLGNAVLEQDAPYHPLGLPSGGMPAAEAAKLGLTLDATPTLAQVLAPRLARMATMRRLVDRLTEDELDRRCGRKPADPYPDQEYVVRRCLSVVLKEEAEHHRYAIRDLAVLEAGG